MLASSNPLEHVASHELFTVGGISVNNHMFMVAVSASLLAVILAIIFRNRSTVPSGLRNFVEAICVYFRNEVARPFLHDQTDKYIGIIWTTFFFILTCNLLGMVPIASVFVLVSRGSWLHFGGTATANIYVTGALAGFMFVAIQAVGIRHNIVAQRQAGKSVAVAGVVGFCSYFANMVPHIEGPIGKVLFFPLLGLEILSMVVKGVALALRLFGNMVAGHILLAVLLLFIAMSKTVLSGMLMAGVCVAGSIAVSCLELLVAFLQAYIFAFLATIFIGMAVHQDH